MRIPAFCWIVVFAALCNFGLEAEDEDTDPSLISPDGRFVFHAFSVDEANAGKPAFGILERESGRLVSDPEEDLGDVSRPEETILWAPDSEAFALTTRVGTRHLDTFLYRWNGTAFRRAKWTGGTLLEELADGRVATLLTSLPDPGKVRRGMTLAGDLLPERWLDPERLVLKRVEEFVVSRGDQEEGDAKAEARAIARWDKDSESYELGNELPVADPWPTEIEGDDAFEVSQTTLPGDDPNARQVTVKNRKSGETKTFSANGWMEFPSVRLAENGWPQIELHTHGPAEFIWRKLYRVENGAYRCVRIDEMTRLSFQAPEGAPRVAVGNDFDLFLIRTRQPREGEADQFESFISEWVSPDGRWKAVAVYSPQYLQRVELVDVAGKGDSTVLYDFDDGEGSIDSVCQLLWSPNSQAVAFYLTSGPRTGETLLYRRSNRVWSKAALPKIDYGFLKAGTQRDEKWQDQFERPLWWAGDRELVMKLSGTIDGDDLIEYQALSSLHWQEDGKPDRSVTTRLWGALGD
ncbi:MAG: hypothetical protein KDM63_03125 [Verrucomicrobiae bacterium]|nr:hypothetical protein [Verrucomicrobiae bacterium]